MNREQKVGFFFRFFTRVSIQERINFARHLAIMIKAGLPIFESIKILRRQTKSKTLGKILDQLISDISNGLFLADGLARFRFIFGDFFINIIRVGETSGTLSTNLLYLADEIRKSKSLRSKVRSAMIYPVIILITTIGITLLLMVFVFPKVIPIFTSLRVDLPAPTKALIAISNFLVNQGFWVILVLVLVPIIFRLLLLLPRIRYIAHALLLKIPIVSPLVININMANFTRVLALLLKSGIPIVEAVNITSQTFNNLVYRQGLENGAKRIRMGGQFSEYLATEKKIFPPLLVSMIEVGENTGNLEDNLVYISDYYSEEVETTLKNLTTLMEPILLLVMGLIVSFVAISIITPIYSITQGINP